jgi:hypothetical protein
MAKSLSTGIVVDPYPCSSFGLASLLQSQGDVAKWTPVTRIEEVRSGRFQRIRSSLHRTYQPVLQKGLRAAAKAIQGFSGFVALGGRMMARSSSRVDGAYGAMSIGWATRRQHKVPILSEAVLLMKNAREHLPGGLSASSWRLACDPASSSALVLYKRSTRLLTMA